MCRFALFAAATLAAGWACGRDRAGGGAPAAAPRRIITTTPSSTEIVAALGGADRLVGRDQYSTYPPEVASLPVVGDFRSPSVDAILQLRPDLVILDAVQTRTAEALAAGGVRTLVLEMHTIEDVLDGISAVGMALGAGTDATTARAALEAELTRVRARAAGRTRRLRVLAVVDREVGALRGLVAAGPGSYLDELLALIGADNVMAGSRVRYANISPEVVLQTAPEVILDAVHTQDRGAAARDWQALARVPAVAAGRIHMLAESYYISPGPRLGLALDGLEAFIHPHQFPLDSRGTQRVPAR